MSSITANHKRRHVPPGYLDSLLLVLGIALLGAGIAWALDWSSGAYFGVAVLAALAGTVGVTRRMAAEAPSRDAVQPTEAVVSAADQTGQTLSQAAAGSERKPVLVMLVGHSRSGKTRIAASVAEHHPDWAWASCGEFVLAEAKRKGLSAENREETDRFGDKLVAELGAKAFTDRVLENTKGAEAPLMILIDDVYHEPVQQALEQRSGKTLSVEVENPKSLAEKEPSSLDRAATELLRDFPPRLKIEGASPSDAGKRGKELVEKLDAELGLATA
ncbi:MAG TPA: hypothetical protein VIH47_01725 [Solirubrobacterales bacterium]